MATVLDASGMRCPMPIIEAARVLRSLEVGAELEIIASDPAFPSDLRAFCESTGHRLLSLEEVATARWIGRLRSSGQR